jgi:CheY-like chemotaxis protein/anti-sigma regulatory factor (Ser/Thr protein kinase)
LLRLDAEFGASARAKGLMLEVERSQAWVQSDPVLLQGILSNLISNAIKYTRQGRVDVRVIDKGAQLQIEVIDTGQGISADKLELIFKEFVRLDASDSGTEGLGLGLSIVRRYASLMSHALHVQSVPGQGSIFTVTMARAQTPERVVESLASAPTELADDHGLAGLNVLVIDNVELLLVSMSKTLSGWGCEVRSARNMAEAVQSAYQQWPDLVVSDHHLGDREPNGLELIKGLREQGAREGRKRLPALLMTGDVSPQLEAQAREAGVRILHKPVRPKVLRASLAELMRRSAQAGAVPVRRDHG